MPSNTSRRRFIQLAGAGAALSLAGCNALQSDGEDDEDGEDGGAETVTMQIQLGQQAQRQLQQEQFQLQAQMQRGNLTQAQAQERIRSSAAELYGQRIDDFESRIDEDGLDVSVEDSLPEFGVVLVSGDPDALVDTLDYEMVGSIRKESEFGDLQNQTQQPTGGGQTPAQTPVDGGTDTATPEETQTGQETTTDEATPTETAAGTPTQ